MGNVFEDAGDMLAKHKCSGIMCVGGGGDIVGIVVVVGRSSGNGGHDRDKLQESNNLLPSGLIPEVEGTGGCFGQLVVLCKLYNHGDIDRVIKKVQNLIERSDDIPGKLLYSNVSVVRL